MSHRNRLAGSSRARGILLGISYGDAIVATDTHSLEDYGDETVSPPRSMSVWPDLARAEAHAIKKRTGFDGNTVAAALTDSISESAHSDLPDQTRRSLELIADGTKWDDASPKARTQSGANFEPFVRNCVLAPAFHSYPDELEYVTRSSTRITANSTEIMTLSSALTAILAELIVHDRDDQQMAILANLRRGYALERESLLRADIDDIHEAVAELRNDDSRSITDLRGLEAEDGSPERFLRISLLLAFGTDTIESALAAASSARWHPEILTPIVGALMGARFGADAFPEEWEASLERVNRIANMGNTLLRVNERRSTVPSHEPDLPVIHGRPIVGSTYLHRRNRHQNAEMLRPEHAPHSYQNVLTRNFSPAQAVFFDWEHRAHRDLSNGITGTRSRGWVRVPEYTLVDTLDDLPAQDLDRLRGIARRACESANEALELYDDTWKQTLHDDLLGDQGEDRVSAHLGYMIRSINRPLQELEDQLRPEQLVASWEAVLDTTRTLVKLEDYMAVTADLMSWSERDWEQYSALMVRIQATMGALRLAIEAIRALVIRHPEYEIEAWERDGFQEIEMG